MAKLYDHQRVVKLFQRALNAGARRTGIGSVEWNIAGNCTAPYRTEICGRPADYKADDYAQPFRQFTFTGGKMTMYVDLLTRCRKCKNCMQARANEWRYRAREELKRAARSWFGTLTLGPFEHYRVMVDARAHCRATGIQWDTLTDDERFKRVANEALKEVTKYMKRVRKQSRVPLRYICVTEKHKSGLPHFHLLVHEVEFKPVTHKILSTQWTLGFEKWRLVPPEDLGGAGYVTKYISKSAQGRIRASQHYGKTIGTSGIVLSLIRPT